MLLHVSSGMPFVRALLQLGVVSQQALEEEFARSDVPALDGVIPLPVLMDELPPNLCRNLMAVPVRKDARTGTVVVAAVDPFDPHVAEEFAFHLGGTVRVLRGPLSSIEMALSRIERGEFASSVIVDPNPIPSRTPTLRPALGPSPPQGEQGDKGRAPSPRTPPLGQPVNPLSDVPPIPLVRKAGTSRIADELEPVLPLTTSKVPKAPGVPKLDHAAELEFEERRDSLPPSTSRGPFSPLAPRAPFPAITGALDAMVQASSRDEVIDCLVVGMSTIAGRVGLFAVKRGAYRGIACNGRLADAAKFRELTIASNLASLFSTAATAGSYLGPLPEIASHEGLRRLLESPSHEVLAQVVKVGARPAVIIFADQLGDTLLATRRAEELGQAASDAFERIIQEAKGG
jgi:MshEN domain